MSYLVEGGSSKILKRTKLMLHNEPEMAHQLLSKIATVTADYLNMQIAAGVNAVQIFDSWAQALAWDDYKEFSHRYIAEIISKLNRKDIPVISFCKGSSVFAPLMAEANPDVISIDWNVDLLDIKKRLPACIAVQGNLDPHILYADKKVIKERIYRLFDRMKGENGFILTWSTHYARYPVIDIEEAGHEPSVNPLAAANLDAKVLMGMIQRLAPGYRIVFNLYALEGYSHKEIAEIVGITEGASKSQLSRARTILKEQIAKMEGKSYGYAG
ncbi:uncharacterized protein [Henckelia pumila]|uniref:uncharacterized protein n=1 Tax=Henckelia pumila TaxID=405737 RepID=UPI003C6DB9E6